MQAKEIEASAETVTSTDEFFVADYEETVLATYDFMPLSQTECSVRITNKTVATKAIVPKTAEIEGEIYTVTEVATNGFMNSTELVRVSLPNTIKKIGNTAFANCAKLKRINLANVKELGSSVFYKCAQLKEVVIPKSVEKLGGNIFRSINTQVRVRAEQAGEGWASNWNSNNANQNVEYGSKYRQPLELEPVYDLNARSVSPQIIGYYLAAGQPRSDNFYLTSENVGDVAPEDDNGNIFIPARYNGVDILGIADEAFFGSVFNKMLIEYSEKEIYIGTGAFSWTEGTSIIINRPVTFTEDNVNKSESTFSGSFVEYIVFPKTITEFPKNMLQDCTNIKNIFFIEPKTYNGSESVLNITDGLIADSSDGVIYLPNGSNLTLIDDLAFSGTSSIAELHIDEAVKNVGYAVIDNWDQELQTVYVHNQNKITTWDKAWCINFTNVIYDREFYKIIFDKSGGEGGTDIIDVVYGLPMPQITVPYLKGFKFEGYYSSNGTMYYDRNLVSRTNWDLKNDATLYARWEPEIYKVYFYPLDAEVYNNFLYATYDKLMPEAEAPDIIAHKTFIGYYDKREGGTQYYNKDMKPVIEMKVTGNLNLYACYENIKYNITYINSKYENTNPEKITYFNTVTLSEPKQDLINPQEGRFEFLGWYLNDKKVEVLKEIEDDIILKARWNQILDAGDYSDYQISEQVAEVNFSKIGPSIYYELRVSPTTMKMVVKTSLPKAKINLNIVIEYRNSNFDLTLENINIVAHSGRNAIVMKSDYTLNLYANNATVSGTDNLKINEKLQNVGSSAVYCKYLTIYSPITLRGGNSTNWRNPAGVAVALAKGGILRIKSNDVIIAGGDAVPLSEGLGECGLPVYGVDGDFSIADYTIYSNVTIKKGFGMEPEKSIIGY